MSLNIAWGDPKDVVGIAKMDLNYPLQNHRGTLF